MTDVALSTVFANQRRKLVTLTASDAAVAIPSWARMAYITGSGGGGSGAVRATTGSCGGGGSSAASVLRLPVVIISGTSTLAVTIGAGGAGPSATAQTDGTAGGATTITIGSYLLIEIGGGDPGLGGIAGGAGSSVSTSINKQANVITSALYPNASGMFAPSQVHFIGANPGGTGTASGSYGVGGSSLFGIGGAGLSAAPSANTAGANGTGYGSGGAGALWLSGAAVKAGNGANGFVQIEFVEGA
jgi:hypothetical protein